MQREAPEAPAPALSGVIPSHLQYGVETNPALASTRSLMRFGPENPGTFSPTNNIIRIPVRSLNFLDLSEARLSWILKQDAGAAIQY